MVNARLRVIVQALENDHCTVKGDTRISFTKKRRRRRRREKRRRHLLENVEKKMTVRLAHGRLFCDVFPSRRNEMCVCISLYFPPATQNRPRWPDHDCAHRPQESFAFDTARTLLGIKYVSFCLCSLFLFFFILRIKRFAAWAKSKSPCNLSCLRSSARS